MAGGDFEDVFGSVGCSTRLGDTLSVRSKTKLSQWA
jgi:hypothetical protein